MSIDKTIDKIREALSDPKAPWYGSDVVAWTGDLIEEYTELRNIVQISCNPPNDCNDPKVLKTYMKACFDLAMKE